MKILSLALCLIGCLVLAQCGSVPPVHYYRVNYDVLEDQSDNKPLPVTIGVMQFDADELYQGDRIVYRKSPYEVNYYYYRRWAMPPRRMVTDQVVEQFQNSGLFQKVVRIPSAFKIDYLLGGEITSFEELDKGDGWYGLVTISFKLRDAHSNNIIWADELSQTTKVEKKDPIDVVKAISQSLKQVVEAAIEEIQKTLQARSTG